MSRPDTLRKGPLSWMTTNSVAANLLMLFLLIGGFIMVLRIQQEVFPEFDLDTINVTVPYPGASPEEIESGIILVIEEAVRGIEDVDEVTSTASEGVGVVSIELMLNADSEKVLRDVRNEVDRITTFPEDAEEPQIQQLSMRRDVMTLVISGPHDHMTLRNLAEMARREMLNLPQITQVELSGVKPLEIRAEVSKSALRAHDLTLAEIAQQIRTSAVEIPGGDIKTEGGEILIKVDERRDWGTEYANIPIISRADGTELLLKDIATIIDGFSDVDLSVLYNSQPAVMVEVFRVGEQTPLEIAEAVKKYVEEFNEKTPDSVSISIWQDWSDIYKQRLHLLLKNAYLGLILVLIVMGLFLEIRLAFWVTMGIPISFLGSMLILPYFGVTINMLSLFAFIMALGIVVDDAIVVGENIFKYREAGMNYLVAAIRGVREMSVPVTFAILTNVVAFMPMFFVPGTSGKFFRTIPSVVISAFLVSLIEALFILPAHLGHHKSKAKDTKRFLIQRIQKRFSLMLERFVERQYQPVLKLILRHRYPTVAILVALLIVIIGYVQGGRIAIIPMERIDSDVASAQFSLPFGSLMDDTVAVQTHVEDAMWRVLERNGGRDVLDGVLSRIGVGRNVSGSHQASISVNLVDDGDRDFTVRDFINEWRNEIGDLAGIESFTFSSSIGGPGGGKDLNLQLSHSNREILEEAASVLAERVEKYENTSEVDDGYSSGKPQYNFKVSSAAASLGVTASEIGRQLRGAFYGAEALRLQRDRDEVKVMVTLPEREKESIYDLHDLLIRTPGGGEIPLDKAAEIDIGESYTSITRKNGRRVLNVTAEVTPQSETAQILSSLQADFVPELLARYPGLTFGVEGGRRDLGESMASLTQGFMIAMVAIYAMLAIPFKSYIQPLVVMISIPFGMVGAVLGHIIMGYNLSLLSMMGIVALSGVVVNDSLILIDYANQRRRYDGIDPRSALVEAGMRRFRPIMLTTATTFLGLTPLIFETSLQAKFLIPMALSLGYGILFATIITLGLVPALTLIIEDVRGVFLRSVRMDRIDAEIRHLKNEKSR